MAQSTIGAREVAKLFFMLTTNDSEDIQIVKLQSVIEVVFKSGVVAALEKAKQSHIVLYPNECKGKSCRCFLCILDELIKENS